MKIFIYKITIFSTILLLSVVWILSMADGYTDPYYIRFTTPRKSNLIIGTSRAAQGIQPEVLNEILNREFFNYAFTMSHSPYGPIYLESIQKKLDDGEKNGVFVITIDPWSISSKTSNPNDSSSFREVNLCLENTSKVNRNPNFSYLIKNLQGNFYKILFENKSMYLHDDGWLEVSIKMDSISVNKRLIKKIKNYSTSKLPYYHYSSLRMKYLLKTIEYLNNYGKVYLVRLPVSLGIMEIENELMPDFYDRIQEIIPMTEGFLDLTEFNEEYVYTDGNHLSKESGKLVSEKIAIWIDGQVAQN